MISFNYETEFKLDNESQLADWISGVIKEEGIISFVMTHIYIN